MRISTNPSLPGAHIALVNHLRLIVNQLNGITEGRMYSHHAARSAVPTTGTYAVGDIILNTVPAESGSGGMKYALLGWQCLAAGTPGTWAEIRYLTAGTGGGGGGSSRFLDVDDDIIIDDSAKGLVLKSPDGHYWRVQVTNAGALTTTDLGLTKP